MYCPVLLLFCFWLDWGGVFTSPLLWAMQAGTLLSGDQRITTQQPLFSLAWKKKKKAFHCLYQTVSLIPIQEVQERDLFDTVGTTFMVRWLTRLIFSRWKKKISAVLCNYWRNSSHIVCWCYFHRYSVLWDDKSCWLLVYWFPVCTVN